MAARIIAGQWRGRRIATPTGDGTRPTTDRVREALFSSLESEFGGLGRLRVLDLFAGSGALGLEALSRGAEHADLVESDSKAAAVIARNIADLGAAARLHRMPAKRYLTRLTGDPFDLVFVDPPYDLPGASVGSLLTQLRPHVADDGIVVVERRSTRDDFAWPPQYEAVRDRAYGETHLWYGR